MRGSVDIGGFRGGSARALGTGGEMLVHAGETRIGLMGVGPRPVVIGSPEQIDDVVTDPWKRALLRSLVEDAIRRAS